MNKEAEELRKAWDELIEEIAKALYIDKFVRWLERVIDNNNN